MRGLSGREGLADVDSGRLDLSGDCEVQEHDAGPSVSEYALAVLVRDGFALAVNMKVKGFESS
jgi:hypothetical protein